MRKRWRIERAMCLLLEDVAGWFGASATGMERRRLGMGREIFIHRGRCNWEIVPLPNLRVKLDTCFVMVKGGDASYHRGHMTETATQDSSSTTAHSSKYTRNNPYFSTVTYNELLTAPESEKETRHIELSIEEGMTYTPGDAVGIAPENREQAVVETLAALGFTGDERVLDHYKVEISLEKALRNRLTIGKLTRSCVNQFAKLAKDRESLQAMTGPDNKARAEEYCWGREFVDLVTDFPGVVTEPQQLFHVLQRLTPRLYSIASSQAMHGDKVHTTVRVVRYESHGRDR